MTIEKSLLYFLPEEERNTTLVAWHAKHSHCDIRRFEEWQKTQTLDFESLFLFDPSEDLSLEEFIFNTVGTNFTSIEEKSFQDYQRLLQTEEFLQGIETVSPRRYVSEVPLELFKLLSQQNVELRERSQELVGIHHDSLTSEEINQIRNFRRLEVECYSTRLKILAQAIPLELRTRLEYPYSGKDDVPAVMDFEEVVLVDKRFTPSHNGKVIQSNDLTVDSYGFRDAIPDIDKP